MLNKLNYENLHTVQYFWGLDRMDAAISLSGVQPFLEPLADANSKMYKHTCLLSQRCTCINREG